MPRLFTIHHAGNKTTSKDLIGLQIHQTDDGFEVIEPPRRKLANSKLINVADAPLLSFTFKHKREDWTLNVLSVSEIEMKGKWTNGFEQESDNWTATGSGAGEETGKEDARSASAT